MTHIDPTSPILVTGATGYVAGRLVKLLLEKGHTVHAAVRDPGKTEKLKYLNALAESLPGQIHYFKSDLLTEGSYAEAMAGCELVFHTASPFAMGVKDPQKELVDPAKLGTRNVLEEASRTPSVKRVVVTSSMAAIYGDNVDLKHTPNGVFTEEIWNTTSSLKHQPYYYSKTVAEKEAWDIAGKQDRWDLVTINPSFVLGPGINPHSTGESYSTVKQMGDGTLKAGAPKMGIGVVDVRDVALAHYKAGTTPEAAGRYLTSAHNTDLFDMAQELLPKYGNDYPLPRKPLPKWLVWLVGPMLNPGITRKVVSLNTGFPWKGDNSKIRKELGIEFRPLRETMEEMFQHLIDNGVLEKKA